MNKLKNTLNWLVKFVAIIVAFVALSSESQAAMSHIYYTNKNYQGKYVAGSINYSQGKASVTGGYMSPDGIARAFTVVTYQNYMGIVTINYHYFISTSNSYTLTVDNDGATVALAAYVVMSGTPDSMVWIE